MFGTEAVTLGKAVLESNNGLLLHFAGTTGMKTGFICASGLNIVATVERQGRSLMAVVLGGSSARERNEMTAELFLRGLSEALVRRPDWVTVENNLMAYLRSASDDYACPSEQVVSAMAAALRALVSRRPALGKALEERFLSAYPGREQARSLVAEAGVDAARLTAWRLLGELATISRTVMHVKG